MFYLKIFLIILLSITFLITSIFLIKSKKILKILILNSFLGIAAIIIINITRRFTGVYIHINEWTIGTASILGMPAVFGYLLANFIFI